MTMFTPDTDNVTIAPTSSDGIWTDRLEALTVQLEQGNLEALASMEQILALVPEQQHAAFEELSSAVNALDFERARELLHALRHSVTGD
jgi:RNA binding exosome subunit